MCLATPGRILAVAGRDARVDFHGIELEVHLDLLPDAEVGEYVLVHAGFAIQRLDFEKALAAGSLSGRSGARGRLAARPGLH